MHTMVNKSQSVSHIGKRNVINGTYRNISAFVLDILSETCGLQLVWIIGVLHCVYNHFSIYSRVYDYG